MKVPSNLQKFIRLETKDELPHEVVRKWFNLIEKYGPDDIISSVTAIHPKNGPAEIRLVHRKTTLDRHLYDIPLKRDLLRAEMDMLARHWDHIYKDGDFIIECSQAEMYHPSEDEAIVMEVDAFDSLCEEIAKAQHQQWVKERTDAGWRYGDQVSHKEKTHPMLRQWSDLPKKYRKIDKSTPKVFLEQLNKQGYSVVKTDELKKLLNKIHGDES
jgi:hypothetical protein